MNVSVHGLGKLGLPLALVLAEAGHDVIGVDPSQEQLTKIHEGDLWVEDGLEDLWYNCFKLPAMGIRQFGLGTFGELTTDGQYAAEQSDVSFIIVPTPSGKDDMFINDYVVNAATQIGSALVQKNARHTVIVVSTVMPGASDNVIIPAIERASGRKVNEGFYYCYSPEFIALGSVIRDLKNPEFMLLGTSSDEACDKFRDVTDYVDGRIPTYKMSVTEAEITKIALNTYVTMKISFANQLDELCETMAADGAAVLQAIGHDSRIGEKYLTPGPPFGGPCFPRDARAFSGLAARQGVLAELAEATNSVNSRQVRRVMDKIPKNAKRVGVIGLTYKTGTSVTEESFGIKIMKALDSAGLDVTAYDPIVQPVTLLDLKSCDTLVFALPYELSEDVTVGKKCIHVWK